MEKQNERLYTVGELAKRCGITVRTLQYYDSSGLLSPGYHSDGGRRLYGQKDIFRLQQILFFKSFGFPLEDIRNKLLAIQDSREFIQVLNSQKDVIAEQIRSLQEAMAMIDHTVKQVEVSGDLPTENLFHILELIKQGNSYAYILKYFHKEEVSKLLDPQRQEVAFSTLEQMKNMTDELIGLYKSKTDPASPESVDFARRWMETVNQITKGDPGLLKAAFSAGEDVNNWPDEMGDFKYAIKDFLGPAINAMNENRHLPVERNFEE
jgi:MerR family transcriptional regulator, thiopeptide resistance regulator